MIDNREKYQDRLWEFDCLFGSHRGRVYKEDTGLQCHTYINNQGWGLVYSFGSEEECRQAVMQHNKELKIKQLLLQMVL